MQQILLNWKLSIVREGYEGGRPKEVHWIQDVGRRWSACRVTWMRRNAFLQNIKLYRDLINREDRILAIPALDSEPFSISTSLVSEDIRRAFFKFVWKITEGIFCPRKTKN